MCQGASRERVASRGRARQVTVPGGRSNEFPPSRRAKSAPVLRTRGTGSRPGREAVELVLEPNTTPQQVLDRLRDRGAVINRFEITTPTLHDIFLKLAGENDE